MNNYTEKEKLYLQAKRFYYEGNPIMSDYEFDLLEDELKKGGSTVHLIVGSTELKELTYKHLSPMLSLDKEHATETEICIPEMIKFFGSDDIESEDSPKFDGSSCNLIYKNGKLELALTRGNGTEGQNITPKMKLIVPNTISDNGVLEIRGEVVIPIKIFNEKYFKRPYENERNMVAGVLGKEKKNEYEEIVPDFHFVAYEVKKHEDGSCTHIENTYDFLKDNGFIIPVIKRTKKISEFKTSYDYFFNYRGDECPYRLDGIVKKVHESIRPQYGENRKTPLWAMAIKFPAIEAKTKILSLSYTVGLTGELSFVANIEPTRLDGSTVSRVSVTNLGNIISKGLFPGAEIILVKSGDIIPYVKSVITPNFVEDYTKFIPTTCPSCGSKLVLEDIHLMCKNDECSAKAYNRLEYGIRCLDIKHIGTVAIQSIFDSGIKTIIDFFDDSKFNKENLIASGNFKEGRALEIILNARNKVKELSLKQVIQALKFKDVGETISEQVANYLEGKEYSWSGLTKEAINPFLDEKSNVMITLNKFIETLKTNNIKITKTEVEVKPNNAIIYEMTGSPKDAGYAKKEDFMSFIKSHGYYHGKLNKNCNLLITDSMSSTSSKMVSARKLGVEIMTYDMLIEKLK